MVLDTTVLVYAVGTEHPLREPCRLLVSKVGSGDLAATTTVEVIQEFAHVRARRRGRADAATLAGQFATLLAPLVVIDADDLRAGLDLWSTAEGIGAFDAVLAAAVLRRPHVTSLVSADAGFADVVGLRHLTPEDAARA